MTQNDNGLGPRTQPELQRDDHFYVGPKSGFSANTTFLFPKKTPEICKRTNIYLGKRYFFICTTLPGRRQNMVSKEVNAFFWAKKLGFRPKIRFFPYDPNFGRWPICSPRSDGSFPTLGTLFRLSVPELQLFPKKKSG